AGWYNLEFASERMLPSAVTGAPEFSRKGITLAQKIEVHEFPNGLVLLGEVMDWVESASFSIALPAGCARDPEGKLGLGNFASEMCQRGCGPYDSRGFVEALDRLGADRSSSVTHLHSSYSASMLASDLPQTLAVYAELVRRPHVPAEQLEEGRMVCLHEQQALEDDLAQRTIQTLKRLTYPAPWGRTGSGNRADVESITIDEIKSFVSNYYQPRGAVISVAGNIDWSSLVGDIERLFGDWDPIENEPIVETAPSGGYEHIQYDSNQTHIGVSYPTVPYAHEDYFLSRGAVGALSDGMSSRLFTEVREVRGLCYTVYAAYHSLRNAGRVMCYAGTSTDRAQETLDVMTAELVRLKEGINEAELRRLKARVRSSLIMQQEITTARSGAMAADWHHLGRVRTMDEVSSIIEDLTCDRINKFLAENPPGDFVVVTLGAQPLEMPVGVS
ncbi:MAG: pitrilysin family protein, partial [Planctomycetota bacterium]